MNLPIALDESPRLDMRGEMAVVDLSAMFQLAREEREKLEEESDSSPSSAMHAYCRIVVSVQLEVVRVAVPPALNRITPEASEQNAR